MFGLIKSFFSGSAVKSVESIAKEWIETDMEQAEAKTLMIKTLDPNGLMRRDMSKRVTDLYTLYLIIALLLLTLEFLGVKGESVPIATAKITELFGPITTLFGVILTASFGVNSLNSYKDK